MYAANTYNNAFISDAHREVCQADAAGMVGNGFPGGHDEAFAIAYRLKRLEALPLTTGPSSTPEYTGRPAVDLGIDLLQSNVGIYDLPLPDFWASIEGFDSILQFGDEETRLRLKKLAGWVVGGIPAGLESASEAHRKIVEGVLHIDPYGDVDAQLSQRYDPAAKP